jgi:hypothetical protein
MRSFRAAAAKWYRKAADQGPPAAHIASSCAAGAGVPPFMATGDFGAINCLQARPCERTIARSQHRRPPSASCLSWRMRSRPTMSVVCRSASSTCNSWAALRKSATAVTAAIAHGWLILHPSGGYLTSTQAGGDDQRLDGLAYNRRRRAICVISASWHRPLFAFPERPNNPLPAAAH